MDRGRSLAGRLTKVQLTILARTIQWPMAVSSVRRLTPSGEMWAAALTRDASEHDLFGKHDRVGDEISL